MPVATRYVGGMALDITRQKRAEQTVIESEQRVRMMAEVSPVMIWVTNSRGTIEFVNRAYREFFGVTDEQVRTAGGWQALVQCRWLRARRMKRRPNRARHRATRHAVC
jgi:PAS domain S-box-containing protein